jgi:hypothetical protein
MAGDGVPLRVRPSNRPTTRADDTYLKIGEIGGYNIICASGSTRDG